MKHHQLKAFLAVAEHRSIRSAAKSLFVAQPSVTRMIRELEEDLGFPLVVRSTTGVSLTAYGAAFRQRARLLLEESRRARQELSEIANGLSGSVRIGTSALASLTLLPRALVAFRQQMPNANVHCVDGLPPVALPELRSGALDFLLTDLSPALIPDDLECELLLRTPQVVGARSDHPHRRRRSLSSLADDEWVYWDRQALEATFRNNGHPAPPRIMEIESFVGAVGLVAESPMLSLFSAATMASHLSRYGLGIIAVRDSLPDAVVSAVCRRGSILTPAAEALLAHVRLAAEQVRRSLASRRWRGMSVGA